MIFKQSHKFKDNPRVAKFFQKQQAKIYQNTDRLFAVLIPVQWILAIVLAWILSPFSWNGTVSSIHPHLWAAIIIGGLITALPVFLAIKFSGRALTRYAIATSQILMSSLLIHVTGGRIETHFHIFGSLAFLAFYRDWRVLIPATMITAVDHLLRGWIYPQTIYGISANVEWRWLEHFAWVIFEDIFLIILCRRSVNEMWESAVATTVLDDNERRYRAVVEQTTEGIFLLEPETLRVVEGNQGFARLIGYKNVEEVKGVSALDFDPLKNEEIKALTRILKEEKGTINAERKYRRKDGSLVDVEIIGRAISYGENLAFCVNARDITERKQAEAEIKRLALVAERTQNAVIIINARAEIEWVNNGFTRISGYCLDEVIGKTPMSVLHGRETSQQTADEIIESLHQQKPFAGEVYNYGKDGRGYWISLSIVPIHDKHGELTGFIGVETDITEIKKMEKDLLLAQEGLEHRVASRTAELLQANELLQNQIKERERAEEALRKNEAKFRDLFDNAPVAYHEIDMQGRYTRINHTEELLLGYTDEELKGRRPWEIIAEKVSKEAVLAKLAGNEPLQAVERTFIRKDGSLVSVLNEDRRIYDADGNVTGIRTTLQDITELKRVENQLSEAKKFLDRVIDNVPNLIFVKDRASRYVLANQPFASLYGMTVDEVIGKTDADLVDNEEELEKHLLSDRQVLEENLEMVNEEDKITDSEGILHWMQTVKRPMSGNSGVEYILGIATDLTERKTLESQLRHAQKLESIGQLAAGIAHEINTPTQYVGDNINFLLEGFEAFESALCKYDQFLTAARTDKMSAELITELDNEIETSDLEYFIKEVPKAVQQAQDGVSRIAKIVQSMKYFAHPGEKEKCFVDLNKAIESTITVARNEWRYVADMTLNFDENLPQVPCLLGEFNQVILNMIINAAHAIGDVVGDGGRGKGEITISTTKLGTDWAEIRIADTGNGIPVTVQNKIFDPFFTTKEVGRGTGQGLAISHTVVVEKHKGRLSFETEPGAGTTFIIQLPLTDVNSDNNGLLQ